MERVGPAAAIHQMEAAIRHVDMVVADAVL